MNQISLGPFIVCFLTSILLAGYLYLILHKSHSIFKGHIKIIFVMLIIIMVRMLFPINFPFTHTIYSYRLMVVLGEVLYVNIIKDIQIFDILIFAWFLGAIIQLIRYLLKRKKTRLFIQLLSCRKIFTNIMIWILYCVMKCSIIIIMIYL